MRRQLRLVLHSVHSRCKIEVKLFGALSKFTVCVLNALFGGKIERKRETRELAEEYTAVFTNINVIIFFAQISV